jgi:diguanylate cyclase (GGDEF)-like protein/PAS domain S-box-containing protein
VDAARRDAEHERLDRFRSLVAVADHVFGLDGATGVMPARMDELAVTEVPVLDPMVALSLVDAAEHALAISVVGRVMEEGETTEKLRMADGSWATLHLFDLRATFELLAGVVVPCDRLDAVRARDRPPVTPRVARCVMDSQGRVVHTTESYRRLFGSADESEASSESILPRLHPEDHQRNVVAWASMLASPGEPHRVRYRRRHADSRWVWCETTLVNRLDDPDDPRVEAEILDISAEMAAHEEVRARERMLQRVAEGLPDGLLQLDGDGQVVFANSRAVRLLGADPTPVRLVEQTVDEDRPALIEALRTAVQLGIDQTIEVRVRPPEVGAQLPPHISRRLAVYEVSLRVVVDESDYRFPERPDASGVFGVICCIADITQRAERVAELEARATFDQLTTIRNRAAIMQTLEGSLVMAGDGRGAGVVFVDLDGFKAVNDIHGHAIGDRLLQIVAARLCHSVRAVDTVGRLGGDEFLVVCPSLAGPTTAADIAERIDRSLAEPAILGELILVPRASLGLAWTVNPATSAAELVAQADAAMYDAKGLRRASGR